MNSNTGMLISWCKLILQKGLCGSMEEILMENSSFFPFPHLSLLFSFPSPCLSLPPSPLFSPLLLPLLLKTEDIKRKQVRLEMTTDGVPNDIHFFMASTKQFSETTWHPWGVKQEKTMRLQPGVIISGKASKCPSLPGASPGSGHPLLAHGGGNLASTVRDTETFNSMLLHINYLVCLPWHSITSVFSLWPHPWKGRIPEKYLECTHVHFHPPLLDSFRLSIYSLGKVKGKALKLGQGCGMSQGADVPGYRSRKTQIENKAPSEPSTQGWWATEMDYSHRMGAQAGTSVNRVERAKVRVLCWA